MFQNVSGDDRETDSMSGVVLLVPALIQCESSRNLSIWKPNLVEIWSNGSQILLTFEAIETKSCRNLSLWKPNLLEISAMQIKSCRNWKQWMEAKSCWHLKLRKPHFVVGPSELSLVSQHVIRFCQECRWCCSRG